MNLIFLLLDVSAELYGLESLRALLMTFFLVLALIVAGVVSYVSSKAH